MNLRNVAFTGLAGLILVTGACSKQDKVPEQVSVQPAKVESIELKSVVPVVKKTEAKKALAKPEPRESFLVLGNSPFRLWAKERDPYTWSRHAYLIHPLKLDLTVDSGRMPASDSELPAVYSLNRIHL